MEDLYKVLLAMDEKESKQLANRLERYVKGSLAGIFDQRSNINFNNSFTAFSIRNLQDVLRPIAMFMILDFIWTKVKTDLKKRILILDEAWILMQYPDSAAFVFSLAKRARKYYLGLSTITQDVADFLNTDHGKAVVTNSSMQILLRQHPASIKRLTEVFYLSEGEKAFLLSAGIGEGLLFAGTNHVAMQVKASPSEHKLITTNPKEIAAQKEKETIAKVNAENKKNLSDIQSKINDMDKKTPKQEPLINMNTMVKDELPKKETPDQKEPLPNPYDTVPLGGQNKYEEGHIMIKKDPKVKPTN